MMTARTPHRVAAVTALTALSLLAGACGAGGFTRGSVTRCFRTLPTAEAALHADKPRLLGVHLVPADHLPRQVRDLVPPEDDAAVCAVAYSGAFAAGQVAGARPDATGRYAVVLVDARHPHVVASYVSAELPKALRGHLLAP